MTSLAAAFLVAHILVSGPAMAKEGLNAGDATWDLIECVRFVLGNEQNESENAASWTPTPPIQPQQKICRCIQNMVEMLLTVYGSGPDQSGLQISPNQCGIHMAIPVIGATKWFNKTSLSVSLQLTYS